MIQTKTKNTIIVNFVSMYSITFCCIYTALLNDNTRLPIGKSRKTNLTLKFLLLFVQCMPGVTLYVKSTVVALYVKSTIQF